MNNKDSPIGQSRVLKISHSFINIEIVTLQKKNKILYDDINGETILILQTKILQCLILYVKDTLKEMSYIYETIKFLYELKYLNNDATNSI